MAADEPYWLTIDEVEKTHERALALWGGLPGHRDKGLVESAIMNPQNLFHYEGEGDLLVLAVRLGMSIARNHGYNDGNKRTGAHSMVMFLAMNGFDLIMPDDTALGRLMEAVIEGAMSEAELVEHLDPFVYDRE